MIKPRNLVLFGRRAQMPAARSKQHELALQNSTVARCSRLEFCRMLAVDVAESFADATAESRASALIRLRALQDEIALLKQRNPLKASQTSRLAWVDTWSPDGGA